MKLSIELDREVDGRWVAEALELPGVMTYGETRDDAISNSERLAIEVIADRVRHAELPPSALNVSFLVLSQQGTGRQDLEPYRESCRLAAGRSVDSSDGPGDPTPDEILGYDEQG